MFFETLRKKRFNKRKIAQEAISWTDGLTSETFPGRGLIAVSSVEGPRFYPSDFSELGSIEELDRQIAVLFGDDDTPSLTPEAK